MKTASVDRLRVLVCALGLQFLIPVHASRTALSPTVFAPGVISGPNHEAAPAFTPDGKTVYFQRSSLRGGTILVSHLARGRWSKPQIAPFSGTWDDIEPALAPDGSFLVFISNRPSVPGGQPLRGSYNGSSQSGGNMWRVERRGTGWSEPVRLPNTVNRSNAIFAPANILSAHLNSLARCVHRTVHDAQSFSTACQIKLGRSRSGFDPRRICIYTSPMRLPGTKGSVGSI